MILRHVLIGSFFTAAGVISLLVPAVPFICIGALVFGPIELFIGLFGAGSRRPRRAPAPMPVQGPPVGADHPARFCPMCGVKNEGLMDFCTNCGARLA